MQSSRLNSHIAESWSTHFKIASDDCTSNATHLLIYYTDWLKQTTMHISLLLTHSSPLDLIFPSLSVKTTYFSIFLSVFNLHFTNKHVTITFCLKLKIYFKICMKDSFQTTSYYTTTCECKICQHTGSQYFLDILEHFVQVQRKKSVSLGIYNKHVFSLLAASKHLKSCD